MLRKAERRLWRVECSSFFLVALRRIASLCFELRRVGSNCADFLRVASTRAHIGRRPKRYPRNNRRREKNILAAETTEIPPIFKEGRTRRRLGMLHYVRAGMELPEFRFVKRERERET